MGGDGDGGPSVSLGAGWPVRRLGGPLMGDVET